MHSPCGVVRAHGRRVSAAEQANVLATAVPELTASSGGGSGCGGGIAGCGEGAAGGSDDADVLHFRHGVDDRLPESSPSSAEVMPPPPSRATTAETAATASTSGSVSKAVASSAASSSRSLCSRSSCCCCWWSVCGRWPVDGVRRRRDFFRFRVTDERRTPLRLSSLCLGRLSRFPSCLTGMRLGSKLNVDSSR